MLFIHFLSAFFGFSLVNCNSNDSEPKNPLELAVILDSPRLVEVDEFTSSITLIFNLLLDPINSTQKVPEYNGKKDTTRHFFFEQSIVESPSQARLSLENVGMPYMLKVKVFCENFNLVNHPNDDHSCKLSFISNFWNASRLLLIPHVTSTSSLRANSRWKCENTKSFVQWIIHNNQTYEKAVFEWHITRLANHTHLVVWILYFWNSFSLAMSFPLIWNSKCSPTFNHGIWICLGETLIILSLSAEQADLPIFWTVGFKKSFALFAYGLMCCVLSNYLPSLLLMFRVIRSDAHPSPPQYPSPEEQISLDSERTRLTTVLDSARLDSARSTRTAQMDSCMAELKYTLVHLNEFMNYKANAQYRRFLWSSCYNRLVALTGTVLQLVNGVIFLM
ncbi:unnamed protein product [Auanema sp. JU1783]|nr:unnamed protein product [Auanema sp. JU1783]